MITLLFANLLHIMLISIKCSFLNFLNSNLSFEKS